MYLLEHKFSKEVKQANYNYYEPRTLHDSSLSLSTHSILASDLGNKELAYELFQRASEIDMGPNMKSSDHGIHAAAIGGIWQILICGFGGIRMVGGQLRLDPKLPDQIKSIRFPIYWEGCRLEIQVSPKEICIDNKGDLEVSVEVSGTIKAVVAKSSEKINY